MNIVICDWRACFSWNPKILKFYGSEEKFMGLFSRLSNLERWSRPLSFRKINVFYRVISVLWNHWGIKMTCFVLHRLLEMRSPDLWVAWVYEWWVMSQWALDSNFSAYTACLKVQLNYPSILLTAFFTRCLHWMRLQLALIILLLTCSNKALIQGRSNYYTEKLKTTNLNCACTHRLCSTICPARWLHNLSICWGLYIAP